MTVMTPDCPPGEGQDVGQPDQNLPWESLLSRSEQSADRQRGVLVGSEARACQGRPLRSHVG